jgi:hypothetical protein
MPLSARSSRLPAVAAFALLLVPALHARADRLADALRSVRQAEDVTAAEDAFALARRRLPRNVSLHEAYLRKLVELDRPDLANLPAQRLVTLDRRSGLGWAVLALLEHRRGKSAQAIRTLAEASEAWPGDAFVARLAGRLAAWFDGSDASRTIRDAVAGRLVAIRAEMTDRPGYREAYDDALAELGGLREEEPDVDITVWRRELLERIRAEQAARREHRVGGRVEIVEAVRPDGGPLLVGGGVGKASVSFGTVQAYVRDIEVVRTPDGGLALRPVVGYIATGSGLNVQGVAIRSASSSIDLTLGMGNAQLKGMFRARMGSGSVSTDTGSSLSLTHAGGDHDLRLRLGGAPDPRPLKDREALPIGGKGAQPDVRTPRQRRTLTPAPDGSSEAGQTTQRRPIRSLRRVLPSRTGSDRVGRRSVRRVSRPTKRVRTTTPRSLSRPSPHAPHTGSHRSHVGVPNIAGQVVPKGIEY